MHKIRGKIVLQQELYNVNLAHCLCKNSCKRVTQDVQNIDFINISFFFNICRQNQVEVMADAAKRHLRLAKIKVGTHF